MKILILTPINPILNQQPYQALTRMYADNDRVTVLSYPFFADIRAKTKGEQYIPHLFAMMKTMVLDEGTREKVMGRNHTIVVGNSMRDQVFDYVVAYKSAAMDDEVYDKYTEMLKEDEEIRLLFNVDDLYSIDDAEIEIPSIEHLKLFMEGVIDVESKTRL